MISSFEAARGPFARTRGTRGENAQWRASGFDATLGFPGEGPDLEMPTVAEGRWMETASRVLAGTDCFDNTWFTHDLSSAAIHDTLVALAERGNSPDPIAARVQLHPARIERLLGSHSTTAQQAVGGCVQLRPPPLPVPPPATYSVGHRIHAGGLR